MLPIFLMTNSKFHHCWDSVCFDCLSPVSNRSNLAIPYPHHDLSTFVNFLLKVKDDDKTEGRYEKFVAVTGVIIKLITGEDKYIIFDLMLEHSC